MDKSTRSEGKMELTTGYGGPFITNDVEFNADPTGTRAFYLTGNSETAPGNFRRVRINFPSDLAPGEHTIPQPWPAAVGITYSSTEGSGEGKSGTLTLLSNGSGLYHAIGTFKFVADIEHIEHNFEGNFDIRLKQNGVSADISDNPSPFVADHINQDNNDEKRNITWARTRSGDRQLRVFIDKDITLGTHDIAMDKKVSIHYTAQQSDGGQWTFYANSGKFVVTRHDSGKLDATFNCEAAGKPGEQTIKFSNGKVEILDFGK